MNLRIFLDTLVKIKKSTSTTTRPKKKTAVAVTATATVAASPSTRQDYLPPTTGESVEEAELSAPFLDPDILDWEGLTAWQEPHFAESDLGSVPYDSPLGALPVCLFGSLC